MILSLCSVCKEQLCNKQDSAVLLCGHIYHSRCIAKWFTYKDSCPTCRKRGKKCYIKKIYFNETDSNGQLVKEYNNEEEVLRCRISGLQMTNSDLVKELDETKQNLSNVKRELEQLNQWTMKYEKDLLPIKEENKQLIQSLNMLKIETINQQSASMKYKRKVKDMENKLKSLTFIENLIKENSETTKHRMDEYLITNSPTESLQNALISIVSLKNSKNNTLQKLIQFQDELDNEKFVTEKLTKTLNEMREELKKAQMENLSYKAQIDDFYHEDICIENNKENEILSYISRENSQTNPFLNTNSKNTSTEPEKSKWKLTNVLSNDRYKEPLVKPCKTQFISIGSSNSLHNRKRPRRSITQIKKSNSSLNTSLDLFFNKK